MALNIFSGIAVMIALGPARAEVQDCFEIVSLPAVITQQGTHCLKQDLSSAETTGAAITISTNNVIIDLNGFKLGGLGAGPATQAVGILAQDRKNITIRNGSVRGFRRNIHLDQSGSDQSTGHIVEQMRLESGRLVGIRVEGSHSIVRDNFIFATGAAADAADGTAIEIDNGDFNVVSGNVITGVSASGVAYGIRAINTDGTVISGNEVTEVNGEIASRAIEFESGVRTAMIDNTVINTVTGTSGVRGLGGVDSCIDNLATGFTSGVSGCFFADGNRSF